MLYALVFNLVACNEGNLPPNTGMLTHGLFFAMLRSLDPELATTLHANNARQPFTLSPLVHPRMRWERHHPVKAGYTFEMRLTLLNDPLFDSVLRFFMEGRHLPRLHFNQIEFEVATIQMTEQGHPSAGHSTPTELLHYWQQQENLPKDLTLHFQSPTAISRGQNAQKRKRFWLFPEPVAVWHNLRRQWGACGGEDPGKDYDHWIEEHIELSSYQLETYLLDFHTYQQRGFVGSAAFQCVGNRDRVAQSLWAALAQFSFYAGVGYKTSMGLGQVMPEIGVEEKT